MLWHLLSVSSSAPNTSSRHIIATKSQGKALYYYPPITVISITEFGSLKSQSLRKLADQCEVTHKLFGDIQSQLEEPTGVQWAEAVTRLLLIMDQDKPYSKVHNRDFMFL